MALCRTWLAIAFVILALHAQISLSKCFLREFSQGALRTLWLHSQCNRTETTGHDMYTDELSTHADMFMISNPPSNLYDLFTGFRLHCTLSAIATF